MNKKKILVIIGMQNDFISGILGTPEAEAIVPKVVEKIKRSIIKNTYFRYFLTCDRRELDEYMNSREGRHLPIPYCIIETKGMNICPEIDDLEVPIIDGTNNTVLKFSTMYNKVIWLDKSDFHYNDWSWVIQYKLNNCVHNYDWRGGDLEFELIGLYTDICVVSNAFALRQAFPEAEITIDASCCAGTTPELHKAALMTMKSCQMNIINEDI